MKGLTMTTALGGALTAGVGGGGGEALRSSAAAGERGLRGGAVGERLYNSGVRAEP